MKLYRIITTHEGIGDIESSIVWTSRKEAEEAAQLRQYRFNSPRIVVAYETTDTPRKR